MSSVMLMKKLKLEANILFLLFQRNIWSIVVAIQTKTVRFGMCKRKWPLSGRLPCPFAKNITRCNNPILLVMSRAQRYFKAIPKKRSNYENLLNPAILFISVPFIHCIDNPVALFVVEIFHNFGQLLNMINKYFGNIWRTQSVSWIQNYPFLLYFQFFFSILFLLRNPNHIGLPTNRT